MRGVNRVMLIGNLGKDPEVQLLEGNIAVAKFPLATTETFKDRSGKLVSQTEWHTVVLWRGLADLAQKFLHKSSLVYIEGRLRTRSWEDKDGVKKYITEVVGENLIMLDKKQRVWHMNMMILHLAGRPPLKKGNLMPLTFNMWLRNQVILNR
ncbi:single-stranded DNA-binding protein [Niabella sp. W65]|nr:single-stranded DNA-binding protein [Niabella sp. W65]MCH7368089.1 single-stranded DNA-binding protein [Niabella sp. W65]